MVRQGAASRAIRCEMSGEEASPQKNTPERRHWFPEWWERKLGKRRGAEQVRRGSRQETCGGPSPVVPDGRAPGVHDRERHQGYHAKQGLLGTLTCELEAVVEGEQK